MDPEQALIDYFDALLTDDDDAARRNLAALAAWSDKGGYLPGLGNSPRLRQFLRDNIPDEPQR